MALINLIIYKIDRAKMSKNMIGIRYNIIIIIGNNTMVRKNINTKIGHVPSTSFSILLILFFTKNPLLSSSLCSTGVSQDEEVCTFIAILL